jgi:hypothetical protein
MKNLLILTLAVVAVGCGRPEAPVSEAQKPGEKKGPAAADCQRGEPKALMASGSAFRSMSAQEAREVIPVEDGIKLEVRHFGCTHYALEFAFTWVNGKLPEPKLSLKKAADILDGLAVKDEYDAVRKSISAAVRKMSEEPYKQPLIMSETENLTATTPTLSMLVVRYDVAL